MAQTLNEKWAFCSMPPCAEPLKYKNTLKICLKALLVYPIVVKFLSFIAQNHTWIVELRIKKHDFLGADNRPASSCKSDSSLKCKENCENLLQ